MTRLDERQIISIFQGTFGNRNFVSEDVEIFKIGRNLAVIKTDTLVFSTDVPQGMNLRDVARKSVVACVSDFAAKGVAPTHCLVSVSFPRSFSKPKIIQIAEGFKAASKEFGVKILGGDVNEARELVITVSMFGTTQKIIPRNGAGYGDAIIVTGPFGRTGAGLSIVLHGKTARRGFSMLAKKSVYHAKPRLRFGVLASRYLTSAMDSSDGLSTTLIEMSRQSGKRLVITRIPMDAGLEEFAKTNRLDPIDLVFNGGEEYEIVATVPKKSLGKLKQIAKKSGTDLIEIGRVERGSGVFLNDHKISIRDRGWSHFA